MGFWRKKKVIRTYDPDYDDFCEQYPEYCDDGGRVIKPKEAVYKYEPDVWDSELKIVRGITVYVPRKVEQILKAYDNRLSGYEFSLLFKGEWNDGAFYVKDEYVVPKQKVSYANIKYKEDLSKYRNEGYRVVVHKHPSGVTEFSGTDDEHINSHFDVSLLFVDGHIHKGVTRFKVDDTVVLVPVNIQIIDEVEDIEVNVDNIEVETYVYKNGTGIYGYYGGYYGKSYNGRKWL